MKLHDRSYGIVLNYLLNLRGLSYRKVEYMTGISCRKLGRISNEGKEFSIKDMYLLAEVFDYRIVDILFLLEFSSKTLFSIEKAEGTPISSVLPEKELKTFELTMAQLLIRLRTQNPTVGVYT